MTAPVTKRIKRRTDVLVTFFATIITALTATLLPSPGDAAVAGSGYRDARTALGAAAVAALSFSALLFSVFYAVFMWRNRKRQTKIQPLLTPAETVLSLLILLWCLSAFGILEWFGGRRYTASILERLTLPLAVTGIFCTLTPVKTSYGKRFHAILYGTSFLHFLAQVTLLFVAPDATRAASVLAGVVYVLLAGGTLLCSFYSRRHAVAGEPVLRIAVLAGGGFAVAAAYAFVPFIIARHFICAYFGVLLLVGTAFKTRIVGHDSVMLRNAQDYRYHAYHDSLTGCRNRTAYAHDMEKLENASPAPRSIGILYFDINGLKHCNDANGHDAGDRLIVAVAQALCNVCGRTHIYRIGGDEFIGLFPDTDEKELARLIVDVHNGAGDNDVLACLAVGYAYADDRPAKRIGDLQIAAEKEMYIDKRRFGGHDHSDERT